MRNATQRIHAHRYAARAESLADRCCNVGLDTACAIVARADKRLRMLARSVRLSPEYDTRAQRVILVCPCYGRRRPAVGVRA